MAATASVSLSPDSIANLATDFYVSLRARNKARRTIATYSEAIDQFDPIRSNDWSVPTAVGS